MQRLPVDEILPAAVETLRRGRSLVVEAPPGAGKTTRLPPALLDAGVAAGDVLVLEPRRLAARMAARRVAEERGENLGETIGYQVRFEEVAGPATRLRFLTEGVLTRRLLADPELQGVGCVVLDEFHERHLQADLALALLRRLQQSSRPDLKLVAMSATLEAAPVARYLDDCPVLRSEGRRFDVSVEHLARHEERPLEVQVEGAVRRLVSEGLDGHVLVFLPGAASIRRAQAECQRVAAEHDLLVLPLHGELPAAEQDAAVRPSERRKLILSTNVAETSVTIEGVAAVVDSGLARVATHSPWSGLPRLQVARVSRASAVQRAGRAGRTRAGRCLRLYTAQDFGARPAHETPEVRRLDLAESVLELRAAGAGDLRAFDWFEAPQPEALEAAETLLCRLGAVDVEGSVTNLGRSMLRLPLHPRLARIVVEAEARGVAREACTVAALISERDIRAGRVTFAGRANIHEGPRARRIADRHGSSDLLELLDLYAQAEAQDFTAERLRALDLEPTPVRAVERVSRQLRRLLRLPNSKAEGAELSDEKETALLISTLAGYPDRVARRRARTGEHGAPIELLLSGGGTAELAPESVVRAADFLVTVDAEERGDAQRMPARAAKTVVRLASRVEPDWLLDLFPEALAEKSEARWNTQGERVELLRRLTYDQLVVEEWRAPRAEGPEVTRALAEAALNVGPQAFADAEETERFLARVEFVARTFPEARLPELNDDEVRVALAELCEGRRSFAELREAARGGGLLEALRRRLTPEQARLLAQMAPERVTLARGRQARVRYERGQAPSVASRLQDFFGMREGPRIAAGRVALVLQLLAPSQRPVQVTTDLAGFWSRHYPSVRRELGRRYPRHAWPEDPLQG
ncbi:MAG: ATP-dependent helicase HrpB [Pyrinomonadaceae bacterium]